MLLGDPLGDVQGVSGLHRPLDGDDALRRVVEDLAGDRVVLPDRERAAEIHVIALVDAARVDVDGVAALERPPGGRCVRLRPDLRAGRDHRPDGGLLAAVARHERVQPRCDLELAPARPHELLHLLERVVDDPSGADDTVHLSRRLDEPDAVDHPIPGDDLSAGGRETIGDVADDRGSRRDGPRLDSDRSIRPAVIGERAHDRLNRVLVGEEDGVVEVCLRQDVVPVALVVEEDELVRVGTEDDAERCARRVPDRLETGQVEKVRRAHHIEYVEAAPAHLLAHAGRPRPVLVDRKRELCRCVAHRSQCCESADRTASTSLRWRATSSGM